MIGFVRDIFTVNSITKVVLVLNYKELDEHSLQIGQFLRVNTDGKTNNSRGEYLGRIDRVYYKPIEIRDYERSLALNRLNDENLDENTVKNVNFLHYEISVLGEYEKENDNKFFRPSTRNVPSLIDVKVELLSDDELNEAVNILLDSPSTSTDNINKHDLGHLQYGSSIGKGGQPSVVKNIDIGNFLNRRTANFGKTGFGKSNENKVLTTLLAHTFPELSMAIFDINGEYGIQDNKSTSEGLYDAFKELGIKDKLVIYTNREIEDDKYDSSYIEFRRLKMNFYVVPEVAMALLDLTTLYGTKISKKYSKESYATRWEF